MYICIYLIYAHYLYQAEEALSSTGSSVSILDSALIGKSFDEKAKICREQILHWQALLMKIGESRSSNSLSNTSSNHDHATSAIEKSVYVIDDNTNLEESIAVKIRDNDMKMEEC